MMEDVMGQADRLRRRLRKRIFFEEKFINEIYMNKTYVATTGALEYVKRLTAYIIVSSI